MKFDRYDAIHIAVYVAISMCLRAAGIDLGDWQRWAIFGLIVVGEFTSWFEGQSER